MSILQPVTLRIDNSALKEITVYYIHKYFIRWGFFSSNKLNEVVAIEN